MKIFLLLIISFISALTISCSRGGADSSSPAPAPNDNGNKTASELQAQFPNKSGTVFGMWTQDKVFNVYISDSNARLELKCEKKSVSLDFSIQITGNSIKTLESKKVGDKDCSLEVKKDETITFKLKGDQLILSTPGEQDTVLVRMQKVPESSQPSSPQTDNPQTGSTSGSATFELYSGSYCTGTKVIYTVKMNCQSLASSPGIKSVKTPERVCEDIGDTIPAEQMCQVLNQNIGND